MRLSLLILALLNAQFAWAQLVVSNGVGVPARDTVRVLMVFAEVDFSDGPCPSGATEEFKGTWPKDSRGKTLSPEFAAEFFDHELRSGQKPKGFITEYYHMASFGAYVLLGDHLPFVVTVPCRNIKVGDNGVNTILGILAQQPGPLNSARGLPLSAFDQWMPGKQGEVKQKKPDGRIDLLYIIWRNNSLITGPHTNSCAGYGVTASRGVAFHGMEGVNNMASFNVAENASCAEFITVAEHLHGIFGGNNWHSSGGRGMHTFLAQPSSYGLTGQFSATMRSASGWDRWMMEWRNPQKAFVISALNEAGLETETSLITQDLGPDGGTYILRDFITTGDALRIKLPHIDWQQKGDVKNQYLWIENRRMRAPTDRYIQNNCANTDQGRFPKGTPGIYAYLQVGKDIKEGKDIYTSDPRHPNGLASPFFPLSAEGNFDIAYRFDLIQEGDFGIDCNWGNRNVPADPSRSKPNPFTGHNDLYGVADFDDDGVLYNGEKLGIGLSKVRRGIVMHDYHTNGDWLDAFSTATGKMEISLSTNPAPTPVYTYATDFENRHYLAKDTVMPNFENRTIHLSGLSLKFEEMANGDMKVRVRWDDFSVRNKVRWCGNIVVRPHPFLLEAPTLIVENGAELVLERGTSPQYHLARGTDKKGRHLFTDATRFTVTANSIIELKSGSKLVLNDDSEMVLEPGAKIIVNDLAEIVVGPKAKLIELLANQIELRGTARIVNRKK